MYITLTIIENEFVEIYEEIASSLSLPIRMQLKAEGTATQKMLDRLGLTEMGKWVMLSVSDDETKEKLLHEQKYKMYIEAPGGGISVTIPLKSIGGAKIMSVLTGGKEEEKKQPSFKFDNELVVVICQSGYTDMVMDAAREGGARGGTVIHAKGTASKELARFLNISIADEKEVILIVADNNEKATIMQSVIKNAGSKTDAKAIAFSLPVSDVQGFGIARE